MDNIYVTIGRQFGSGGREIGKKVAEALGIPYYDKELLVVAAKESGLSHQFLTEYDEKPNNSFLYSLVMGQSSLVGGHQGPTVEQMAAKAQREAVLAVAQKGSCVIVGRCADYILRDQPGLVRVFISADHDARIARICKRDGVTEKEAEDKIKKMDKARAAHYSFQTDKKWADVESYDLCINSSRKGIDAAVKLILDFVKA